MSVCGRADWCKGGFEGALDPAEYLSTKACAFFPPCNYLGIHLGTPFVTACQNALPRRAASTRGHCFPLAQADAKEAFKELLASVGTSPDWTWEQTMRLI
eukprot:scaffold120295_cov20-Tisochrysis_lutea.AAC.1